jgi:hypothetical protein
MSRFLMVDIGAGTMDILYYDTDADLHYKAVVKSPVRYLAEKAARLPGNLLVTGNEMGGGPITEVLKKRAKEAEVAMSVSAAASLHHDLDRVRSWGIRIIDDCRCGSLVPRQKIYFPDSGRSRSANACGKLLRISAYRFHLRLWPSVPRTMECRRQVCPIWIFATACLRLSSRKSLSPPAALQKR